MNQSGMLEGKSLTRGSGVWGLLGDWGTTGRLGAVVFPLASSATSWGFRDTEGSTGLSVAFLDNSGTGIFTEGSEGFFTGSGTTMLGFGVTFLVSRSRAVMFLELPRLMLLVLKSTTELFLDPILAC